MIIDIKRFNEEIEKKCEELFTPYVVVVFQAGHNLLDAELSPELVEILEYDANSNSYSWLSDWYEGHKFINLIGIYSSEELIKILKGLEDIKKYLTMY